MATSIVTATIATVNAMQAAAHGQPTGKRIRKILEHREDRFRWVADLILECLPAVDQCCRELGTKLGDDDEAVALVDKVDLFDDTVCRFNPTLNLRTGYCTLLVQQIYRSPDLAPGLRIP